MFRQRTLVTSLVLPLALAACGDDNGSAARPDAGATIDSGTDAGMAVTGGVAVINSDFSSTSLTLIDPATGAVTHDDCLSSGTTPPGTTIALSGDVALASSPQPGHAVVTVDRANAAVTWLDPADCKPLHQLDVATGFKANPHDLIAVSATKAYVTRYDKNATPTASPADFDEGDDLLIIDPSVPKVTGRIDLAAYAVAKAGATIQARPDRAVLVGTTLYVVLNDISSDFQAMSHGRVAIVDTATDKVTGTIEIPNLYNCGGVAYVEATQRLVVTCAGDYTTLNQALTSGLSYIDVSQSPPVQVKEQYAAAFGGRALGAYSGVANDGALGFAVTPGAFSGQPKDQLWSFDVASGKAIKIDDSTESFTFGTVMIDAARKQILLSDATASASAVRVYDYASGTATARTPIAADPKHHLPPRELSVY